MDPDEHQSDYEDASTPRIHDRIAKATQDQVLRRVTQLLLLSLNLPRLSCLCTFQELQLDAIHTGVKRLKHQAIATNEEVVQQNEMLDHISIQVSDTDAVVQQQTQAAKKVVKKQQHSFSKITPTFDFSKRRFLDRPALCRRLAKKDECGFWTREHSLNLSPSSHRRDSRPHDQIKKIPQRVRKVQHEKPMMGSWMERAPAPAQIVHALLAIALSSVVVTAVRVLRRKLKIARALEPIPGPRGVPLLGILPSLIKNPKHMLEFMEELIEQHGGRLKTPWSIFSDGLVVISSPADVEHVLSTNHDNYIRSDRFLRAVGKVFGKSFLGLNHAHTPDNGEMLRLQRKVGVKVFTTTNFRVFAEQIFYKHAQTMVKVVQEQGGKCEMHRVSSQYTLQAIFDISCGVSLQDVDPTLGLTFINAMDYVLSYITVRLTIKPYYRYLWWCMPSEYKMCRNEKIMIDLAEGILTQRLQESDDMIAKRSDIMSLYIKKARELAEEGDAVLDVSTLRSIFLSFLFAGKDTTSSAITCTFYALAQYPDVQQKLFDEIQSIKTTNFTYEDIKSLKYLDAVVSETMRLYPTVPTSVKKAVEDDHLPDGTFIPGGINVMISQWYMGRHNPVFGDDLLTFRPERWLEMKTRPSVYDFPVFLGGPRICIGMNMALLETKMFVAVMVRHFHVQIQDGHQVAGRPYAIGPTLVMKDGLPLHMTPRDLGLAS